MRKFSSYGPINTNQNYYVPRTELIELTTQQLLGEDFAVGGHYITVWAPRQQGKSWVMQQVLWRLQQQQQVNTIALSLQKFGFMANQMEVIQGIAAEIQGLLNLPHLGITSFNDFESLFRVDVLDKPLILILDEFDSLSAEVIRGFVGIFRDIYMQRLYQTHLTNPYLLHGVALIGVRAVLGVENVTGSPFNVQRSLHVPNLTYQEVDSMFHWYERESGQMVEQAVIDRLFYETQGQPGLTSWLGEQLTEAYNKTPDQPITMSQFEDMYGAALAILPNNNILNIVSKAKQEPYKEVVLELFKTEEKSLFRYDDSIVNFLYMNGVVDWEKEGTNYYLKFPCPFVQKRLFNYFAQDLFHYMGKIHYGLEDMSAIITETSLNIPNLLRRYEQYLQKNRTWLLKDAPRRHDLRLYEAVYHFNFYMYLFQFLRGYQGQVWPEFPTGNGEIDIIINYSQQLYALEVKSFTTLAELRQAHLQAVRYGKSLQLTQVWLILFIDNIDEASRTKYEVDYYDEPTGVTVKPVFVVVGEE